MKHLISIIIMCLLGITPVLRAQGVDGVSVGEVNTTRNGKYMTIDMDINLKQLQVESNRAVLLTPTLVNGNDSLELKSVGIYGRRRYYHYVRNGESMLSDNELTYKASEKPDNVDYQDIVDYKKWMNGAQLNIHRKDYGCCETILAQQSSTLDTHAVSFYPELVYVKPQGQAEKHDSLEGSANIDFPVNKTVIYPEYSRNVVELGKVRATIDSVRSDRDVTITQVWLKGYASPESPYAHNTMLAKGRTEALKTYIQNLYMFGDGVIATDYEPEDWAGLRRFVDNSNLQHRSEILSLIDSNLDPDVKEARIKTSYPDAYRFLLQNAYPALRHTDYRIAYTIRTYSDVEEIKRVMQSRPQKLSLNEFYLLSEQYEPGSDEFTEVFETAVRMYPTDETANLNAANAAMRRDDTDAAQRYLLKAGNSAEAEYARGAVCIRTEQYDEARTHMEKASQMGLAKANDILKDLNKN